MCLYILLRLTKPEYKYLYIFNGKVMYPPKRKIDVINHLSEKLPDSWNLKLLGKKKAQIDKLYWIVL